MYDIFRIRELAGISKLTEGYDGSDLSLIQVSKNNIETYTDIITTYDEHLHKQSIDFMKKSGVEITTDAHSSVETYNNDPKSNDIFLIQKGDDIIGFYVLYHGDIEFKDTIVIQSLYLDEEYRGQGIASSTYDMMVKKIKKRWPNINHICLGVVSSNDDAYELYKHKGFLTVHETMISDI